MRTYLTAALRSHVHNMQRNLRSARMTGRIGESDQVHADVYPVVLQSMLEHGVQKSFPPQAIDPDWSQKHLESALHIYDRERNAIMSSEGRVSLEKDFATATGTDGSVLNNLEHECQLREAHITAKLAAFEAVRSPQTDMLDACRDQAKDLLQCQRSETAQPKPVSTLQLSSPVNIPEKPGPKSIKVVSPPPPASIENLTTQMLRDMHDAAQNAGATSRANYSSGIADVYWRMAKTDEFSEDVAKQRASDLRLFSLVTGIVDVTEIRQFHLSLYRDALGKVPKNFLRSAKDADLTISAVMARANLNSPAANGLSASTMSRHFKSLELLLKRAKSEGHSLEADLDVSLLKPKIKANTPAHKRRPVFRPEEVKQVFTHSAWQGCQSEGRRHAPGQTVIRDAKFWVPLILAYTGARRAEIAGLLAEDVATVDGIPCFHIRANTYRGIKGEGGEIEKSRIIPVHPHLIELGLIDHASSHITSPTGLLCPDILPKKRFQNGRQGQVTKIGESLDDFWRKSLHLSLNGNPRKLCMHSLRHYVNHSFIHNRDIHEVTRFDILGHVESSDAARSINTSTYRDETDVKEKFAAIASLPCVF
ncbi:hypothetical protein [Halocynthiibacter sp.]|uniref:hypothetical protein n=1 Tax=Halocynthiibacter sp. TaxID=1979210 RepID=UPI003C647DA6